METQGPTPTCLSPTGCEPRDNAELDICVRKALQGLLDSQGLGRFVDLQSHCTWPNTPPESLS